MNARQVIAIGLILGLTAAVVVWYLERFETNRMFGQMRSYMQHHDAFMQYLKEHGGDDSSG